ncbi:hypothetical protein MLD38_001743 [Melastoma candidum]|uniref:Uncharacterized protein n=1 Tax=Melastoma candidum TaxID=119954 RepID=A0ACB9SMU2_9MYRT|nr:hypothetical protein MLD38_001743 [Melastoma candidum]
MCSYTVTFSQLLLSSGERMEEAVFRLSIFNGMKGKAIIVFALCFSTYIVLLLLLATGIKSLKSRSSELMLVKLGSGCFKRDKCCLLLGLDTRIDGPFAGVWDSLCFDCYDGWDSIILILYFLKIWVRIRSGDRTSTCQRELLVLVCDLKVKTMSQPLQ